MSGMKKLDTIPPFADFAYIPTPARKNATKITVGLGLKRMSVTVCSKSTCNVHSEPHSGALGAFVCERILTQQWG